jgi:hypothetical protein
LTRRVWLITWIWPFRLPPRLLQDRPQVSWYVNVGGLAARGATPEGPSAEEATEFLRNLPELWDQAEPSGRKLLAEALFERIDALGAGKAKLHPSASAQAQGWDGAWNGA